MLCTPEWCNGSVTERINRALIAVLPCHRVQADIWGIGVCMLKVALCGRFKEFEESTRSTKPTSESARVKLASVSKKLVRKMVGGSTLSPVAGVLMETLSQHPDDRPAASDIIVEVMRCLLVPVTTTPRTLTQIVHVPFLHLANPSDGELLSPQSIKCAFVLQISNTPIGLQIHLVRNYDTPSAPCTLSVLRHSRGVTISAAACAV